MDLHHARDNICINQPNVLYCNYTTTVVLADRRTDTTYPIYFKRTFLSLFISTTYNFHLQNISVWLISPIVENVYMATSTHISSLIHISPVIHISSYISSVIRTSVYRCFCIYILSRHGTHRCLVGTSYRTIVIYRIGHAYRIISPCITFVSLV